MHEVLVNRLGGLSLLRKRVVRLTDRPDMILDVYCGRKTTMPPSQWSLSFKEEQILSFKSGPQFEGIYYPGKQAEKHVSLSKNGGRTWRYTHILDLSLFWIRIDVCV